MSFFPNSTGADVRGGIFNNVGRDYINNIGRDKPDLSEVLAPVVDAAYNRHGPISRCYQGTRQGVIAQIMEWVDRDGGRPICWLNGPAGSGKSAISQTIAEGYAAKGQLAASFFFFRGEGKRNVIDNFIPTLAHQLSLSVPAMKPLIQSAVDNEPYITHQSLRYQFQKLMIEPILALRNPQSSFPTQTIPAATVTVIDALDKCDDRDLIGEFIENVISVFKDNPGLSVWVFVTSQVEEHIRRKLDTSMAHSVVHHMSLQDFDSHIDIRKFFRSCFSTIYEENNRVMRNVELPWPSESDLDTLVEKSDGLFIFAVTLMDFIHKGSGHPHAKLQKALMADAGLDDLYMQVLSDAPHDHNFERVIGTVMLLVHPISINFLGNLLRLDAGDIVQTLLGIQSILMIPGDDDQAIHLFHGSLRDLLITQPCSGDFFINPPIRHLCIAADCLSVIREPLGNDIFYDVGQHYACFKWCHHFYQGLIGGQGGVLLKSSTGMLLMSYLEDFASQSCDFWVNTAIVEGRGLEIQNTLKLLLSSLEQVPNHPQDLLQILKVIQEHVKLVCVAF